MSSVARDVFIQAVRDAEATRLFTVAGVVVLFYDHLLTLADEIAYIWRAPNSFAKYAFLLNRYMVPAVLIPMLNEMAGFNGVTYSNSGCQKLIIATSLISVLSVAMGNMLVLLRVLLLWKGDKIMSTFLYVAYTLSTCLTIGLMVPTTINLSPGMEWSDVVHMCITTTKTITLPAVWGAPIFFEITVVSSVVWNAVSSPRSAQVPLSAALQKDGITFFLAVMVLRLFNMIFAIISTPGMTLFAVCFVWAAVTMVLNRSLLRLRKVETMDHANGPASPFGRLPGAELELSEIPEHDAVLDRIAVRRSVLSASSVGIQTPKPWEAPVLDGWPNHKW